jgi:hypothetical protein
VPWRYCLLTLACGVLLVGGFFLAARSHFASIDFGIKNSTLKKQIEELEADKRRLLLAKEVALSPAEIKKAAKKLGLSEMTASNIASFTSGGERKTAPVAVAVKSPDEAARPKTAEKSADEDKEAKKEVKKEDKVGKTGPAKEKAPADKKKLAAQIAKK